MERVGELMRLNETTTEQVNPNFFYVATTKPERYPRGSPAGQHLRIRDHRREVPKKYNRLYLLNRPRLRFIFQIVAQFYVFITESFAYFTRVANPIKSVLQTIYIYRKHFW